MNSAESIAKCDLKSFVSV